MCSHLGNLALSCQLVDGQSWWEIGKLKLHNNSQDATLLILCHYSQSNVAGRTVTSFPRCLLVRVVECLNKPSSSTSMFSGDTEPRPCQWRRYSLFNSSSGPIMGRKRLQDTIGALISGLRGTNTGEKCVNMLDIGKILPVTSGLHDRCNKNSPSIRSRKSSPGVFDKQIILSTHDIQPHCVTSSGKTWK